MVNGRSRKQLLKDFVASVAFKLMVIMCEKGDEDIIISTKSNIKMCDLYEHNSLTRSIVTTTIW